MKKTFLAKRNALITSASVSWGTLALAFALMALLMRLLLPNVFWYAFSPLLNVGNTIATESHTFIKSFSDASALAVKNEELAKENVALASENQALLKKMESVSALLGEPAARSAAGILAPVVSRPPESPYDSLLVSVGSEDGVRTDMEAFGDGGVPIGVVTSVVKNVSRITLFSAPRMAVAGWVGRTNLPVSIHGEGAGALSASVARSAQIVISDLVYAPGPGMLPIGSVARIDSDPFSPSVTLRIQSSVNLFSLGWVVLRDTGKVSASLATSTLQ